MNHDAVAVQMCLSAGLTEQQTDDLLNRLTGPLHDAQRQLAALQEDYRDLESKLAAVGAGGVSAQRITGEPVKRPSPADIRRLAVAALGFVPFGGQTDGLMRFAELLLTEQFGDAQPKGPKVEITECVFNGRNSDGSEVFQYGPAVDGISKLEAVKMIGWECYGPEQRDVNGRLLNSPIRIAALVGGCFALGLLLGYVA